ncbi:hypothetical protein BDN72DRAFT_846688 [Pluteus cervinus]|uniref:Uncharacterized protein n=1 Tax=Pluteus cervinus TaxID=181527 RepID=A0ACD3AF82_9AGAR|nr:hypothetical protein BDN72DRAFT_846688 [Pluteus cervinus]
MASVLAQSHAHTTFTISGLSREDAYSKISTEILRLEDQIRSLQSLRNSLAPVARLPIEILSKVFMDCCDLQESGKFTDFRPEDDEEEEEAEGEACLNTRLIVSWVSRQWRSVALGHKPLWNLVFGAMARPRLGYARACIERCQRLYIDTRSPSPDSFQFYASHISQIVYFKLQGPIQIAEDFPWEKAAPLLRSLTLRARTPARILDDIASRMCPQLCSIKVEKYSSNWKFFPCVASTIADLAITSPISRFTPVEFINLLESLPLLTTITILDGLKEEPGDRSSSLRCVYLPQLKNFGIRDSPTVIIKLLKSISAPAAYFGLIPWNADRVSETDAEALLHTLRVTQEHVWGSIRHLRDGYWLTAVSASLSPKHAVSCLNSPNNLLLACQTLNLDHLESLWVKSGSSKAMTELSRLTQVRTLWLETPRALKAFVTFMTASIDDQHTATLFPALRELILVELDSGKLLGGLYDILTLRKVWGLGLQKLEFVECESVALGDVFRFKNVVDHVEVNDMINYPPAFIDSC